MSAPVTVHLPPRVKCVTIPIIGINIRGLSETKWRGGGGVFGQWSKFSDPITVFSTFDLKKYMAI